MHRALVIDDDPDVRAEVAEILDAMGQALWREDYQRQGDWAVDDGPGRVASERRAVSGR